MEIKKSPQADLERSKGLSLLLGLVVAIAVMFVTLEWRSQARTAGAGSAGEEISMEDVLLLAEEQQEEQPEEVQQPEQQVEAQLPDDFKVVDDNQKVAEIKFVSADENKVIPPPAPVGPAVVEPEDTEEIFTIVEEPTEFPGGIGELMKWLSKNINYPEIALSNNIQGRVMVKFVVERDGSASNVEVLRGVDPALDKEAVRVVKMMPKWKPGKQRGKPVRQSFVLPVQFKIQG